MSMNFYKPHNLILDYVQTWTTIGNFLMNRRQLYGVANTEVPYFETLLTGLDNESNILCKPNSTESINFL